MRTSLFLGAVPMVVLLSTAGAAFAVRGPSGPGQPSVECGEDGLATDHRDLAHPDLKMLKVTMQGEGTPSLLHANSEHAVSQYDVAVCN